MRLETLGGTPFVARKTKVNFDETYKLDVVGMQLRFHFFFHLLSIISTFYIHSDAYRYLQYDENGKQKITKTLNK